jgi:hypothetical protein
MFEFILGDPIRLQNLNDAMKARSSQTLLPYDLFPFKARLAEVETTDDMRLLVDVGSGMGQATFAIRRACQDIPGQMVMQDQAEVIESIQDDIPEGVITMAHNFFTPQPIRGISSAITLLMS